MNEEAKHNREYSVPDIKKYLSGELSAAEMHAIEKAALDDPFLADAIEGMRSLQNRSFEKDIDELRKRLQKRTAARRRRLIVFSNSGWWRVAAVVLLSVGLAVLVFPYLFRTGSKPVALHSEKAADSSRSLSDEQAPSIVLKPDSAKSIATESVSIASAKATARSSRKRNEVAKQKDSISAHTDAAVNDKPVAKAEEPHQPAAVQPSPGIAADTETKRGDSINGFAQGKTSALQEVVVTAMGVRNKKSLSQANIQRAAPEIGWDAYKKYLQENKKMLPDSQAIKGKVIVSFTVKKNGKLSNFHIIQSLDSAYDTEAIRLIKDGPAWKPLSGKKTRATFTVEF